MAGVGAAAIRSRFSSDRIVHPLEAMQADLPPEEPEPVSESRPARPERRIGPHLLPAAGRQDLYR